MKYGIKRTLSLFLSVALLLTSCGGGAKATAMHLRKTEGRVSVSDDGGRDLEPRDDLGLYSGYGVDTRRESYAWIDLDEVKLTKLDENSEIEITKEGRDLEIEVLSGSLFFNVTEPLAGDETMTIRTSTMAVGIRGTCGWVALSEDEERFSVYLLEGKVRCEADGEKETVRAGEMAVMTEDGQITVEKFTAADVPAFVLDEIEDDDDLMDAVPGGSGGGVSSGDLGDYAGALAELKKEGEILYTETVDFEADGNPELLVLHTRDKASHLKARYEKGEEMFAVSVYRNGPDGTAKLYFGTPQLGDRGRFSLVGYGDRIVMGTYSMFGSTTRETYNGSIAEKDGTNSSWSGADSDWVLLDWLQRTNGTGYSRTSYDPNRTSFGGLDIISAEEYAAAKAKYKELKVLAYSPDGESLVITPDPSEVEGFPPLDEPGPADPGSAEPDQAGGEVSADFREQYRTIIQQADSYEYYIWPEGVSDGFRYALYQEEGYSVPTLILKKLGLDRHGFQLFRYNPDTGTTEQIGSDSVTRFEFPSHKFINDISYDQWYNITDTSALDAWTSTAP